MDKQVNRKKLFRNFLQLNTSTPKVMTKVDRFRFFKEYLRLNPIVQDQKSFLQLADGKPSARFGIQFLLRSRDGGDGITQWLEGFLK